MEAEELKIALGGGQTGTYVLELYLPEPQIIGIGKLGCFPFKKGYYYYCGSAFGPGGVAARCRHHIHISEKPRWHIDYLRARCSLTSILFSLSKQHLEHRWAEKLGAQLAQPILKFGASDCDCHSHLFFSKSALATPGFSAQRWTAE